MSTPAYDNDDRFRQRLENYREMPADSVWDGIAAALDKQKRKRRVLFRLWSAGAGLSTAAVLLPAILLTGSPSAEGGLALRALHSQKYPAGIADARLTTVPALRDPSSATAIRRNKTENETGASSLAPTSSGQFTNSTSSPFLKAKTSLPAASGTARKKTSAPGTVRSAVAGNHEKNAGRHPAGTGNSSDAVAVKEDRAAETVPGLPAIPGNMAGGSGISSQQTLPVISPEVYGTVPLPAARRTEILSHVPPVAAVACLDPVKPVRLPFEYHLSLQGNLGSVAYDRMTPGQTTPPPDDPSSNTNDVVQSSSRDREGLYLGSTFKAMFVFKRHLYLQGGLGYESFAFNDPYRFTFSGISSGVIPGDEGLLENTKTGYGEVIVPVSSLEENSQDGPGVLSGKLRYRMQQLLFPVEIGYRFEHRKFGFSVGAGPGFHVPLGQQAVFVTESGDRRDVNLRRLAPFNVSLGLETGVEYRPIHKLTLFTGLNLRYQMLNIYPDSPELTRPYSVSLYLGLRLNLFAFPRK